MDLFDGSGITIPMAIIENRSYFDTMDDKVGQAVRKINPKAKQAEYRESKDELFKLLRRLDGSFFQFRKKRLSLEGVNDSVLIRIGPAKRGHLSAYRGEWVRVIWFATYGFSMNCLVHKVKVSPEAEKRLVLRGPYTKEEFTDEVAEAYPFREVTVDGVIMLRSARGNWVSSVPTDRALDNLEKDEIPDGATHYRPVPEEGKSYPHIETYHKFAGFWIKSYASREEFNSGSLDWVPVGTKVHVRRFWDIPSGTYVRTADGWRNEI